MIVQNNHQGNTNEEKKAGKNRSKDSGSNENSVISSSVTTAQFMKVSGGTGNTMNPQSVIIIAIW